MKTVIAMRHAKTEATHSGGDYYRELTKRGRSDAALAIQKMRELSLAPDAVITSSATRALQTAIIVANQFEPNMPVIEVPELYSSTADRLLAEIRSVPDAWATIVLVAHNPGMLDLANLFIGNEESLGHLQTSGFTVLEQETGHWNTFAPGQARFVFVYER